MFSGSSFWYFFFIWKVKPYRISWLHNEAQSQGHANNLSQFSLTELCNGYFKYTHPTHLILRFKSHLPNKKWNLLSSIYLAGEATCYSPTENWISSKFCFRLFNCLYFLTSCLVLHHWLLSIITMTTAAETKQRICRCVPCARYYALNFFYLRYFYF